MLRVRGTVSTVLLDATAAEEGVIAAASEAVGVDRFTSGAATFAAANPQSADLFDLGDVSASVGVPAGYGCLYAATASPSS